MSDNTLVSDYGMCEEEQVARIAWFYYHDGLTQSEISERLGLTRLKVSRLLEKGHQSGIIRVQINSRFEGCLEYENALRNHFALQNIRVLPGRRLWRSHDDHIKTPQRIYLGATNPTGHVIRRRGAVYDRNRPA